jgi:prepilin-type processing-associated H-X9-DG protein/prepilin-type N-terminal cleavage/methylation domain-containing protein
MTRPAHHRRFGFTLVELLVVIGIIALLISILLPTLTRARQSANSVACLSNLRQVGTGLVQYANDERMWLPSGFGDDPTPNNYAGRDPKWYAWVVLGKYTTGGNVLTCGADQEPLEKTGDFWWSVPAGDRSGEVLLSYMYNAGKDREFAHRKLSSITGSVEMRAVGDKGDGDDHNGTFNFELPNLWEQQFPFTRHDGRINFAFFDGHAEQVEGAERPSDDDVWTFQWPGNTNNTPFFRAWDAGYHLSNWWEG